jgi:hypothetical protein
MIILSARKRFGLWLRKTYVRASGMETILVLSGVTRLEDVARFPYQPTRIVCSVAEIEP